MREYKLKLYKRHRNIVCILDARYEHDWAADEFL